MSWHGNPVLAGLATSLLVLAGCLKDETISAYGAAGKTWQLSEIDNVAFDTSATMIFPEPGKIAGMAPCNSYAGTMSVPYPWFEAKDLINTRRACAELDAETQFLTSLQDMTLAEVLGNTLILSTQNGRSMIFKAVD